MLTRTRKPVVLRPSDHGRAMSLEVFENALTVEGYQYELAKGVVEVSQIPGRIHFAVWQALRDDLLAHKLKHPEQINSVTGGSESKILIAPDESERHPDLSVYQTPMPDVEDAWSIWKPEIVIEVVSESSRKRDYKEKPDEYLRAGMDEYWIIDPHKKCAVILDRWRAQWRPRTFKVGQRYGTPLLPGFVLDVKRIVLAGAN